MASLAEKKQPTPRRRKRSARQALDEKAVLAQVNDQLTGKLTGIFSEFWGMPVGLHLLSVSTRMLYFWRMDDFHVTQVAFPSTAEGGEAKTLEMRLSDGLCADLLTTVFGSRPAGHLQKEFSFRDMTDLEKSMFDAFTRELITALARSLAAKTPGESFSAEENIFIAWQVRPEIRETVLDDAPRFQEPLTGGRLIVSLPLAYLKNTIQSAESKGDIDPLPDTVFDEARVPVHVGIGNSRVALTDLQMLEPGDLVVLENSMSERLYLLPPDAPVMSAASRIPFTAQLPERHALEEVPYTQEMAVMEQQLQDMSTMKETLWDSLTIEVGAQFDPVRLPLKQLKQMSEGLVVEIGDIVGNRVILSVEGKALAAGELVIVGDKFGVRVKEVSADRPGTAASPADTATLPAESPARAAKQAAPKSTEQPADPDNPEAGQADELDDFLNEDFDADNFEEENW